MKRESIVFNKAYKFALSMVKAYKNLLKNHREFTLSKQLLRCATSIGANIAEANGAISKSDFSYKISIAYKECLETRYWLSLLKDSDFMDENSFIKYHQEADEIGKILFAILKTTRINKVKS
jgi:four helix bundle protein